MRSWRDKLNSAFFKNCVQVFATKYSIYVIAMATSILTARALGPDGKGTQGIIVAIAGICTQFGSLGLTSANTYYIAKNQEDRFVIMGNSYLVAGCMCVFLAGVWLTSVFWISYTSFSVRELSFAFLLVPIQILNSYQGNCLVAMGKIREYAISELIPVLTYLLLIIICLFVIPLTPYLVVSLSSASYALALLYSYSRMEIPIRKLRVGKTYLKKQFSYGMIVYVICLFQYLVLRFDVLMINQYLGSTDTGYYTIAVNLVDTLNMIYTAVGMLLFPRIASMDDEQEEWKFMKQLTLFIAAVSLAVMFVSIALSGRVILLLYRAEYMDSIRVFNCLMLGTIFRAIVTLENNYIAAKNKNLKLLYITIVCFFLNIVLNAALIPRLGITGAAVASNITYIIMFLFTTRTVVKSARDRKEYGN